ncbi:MAG TPA: Ig-like domain repeat protein [Acidobacteriaceae bacterium]|nr:Ig-like domain repeat protein [Acidobacteriaceae bacterium]
MISQFRQHLTLQLAIAIGLSTGLFAFSGIAQAQVATRTQLTAQNDSGTLSFAATVADAQGAPVSEGSVSFETSRGSLGSVFVKDGAATLHLSHPPQWARTVTAVYHGDAAFANSTASTTLTSDATSSTPGFTVTASPSSLSLTPGQFATVNLTITSQNGFSEAVNLSCSGLPNDSTCSFNPVVATPPANGSTISAMQIDTTAASGIYSDSARLGRSGALYALLIPGALALAGIGALRRKNFHALRALGLVMLLAAGTLGLTACNVRYRYEHYQPSPNVGTTAGSYTVIVAAYSSNGTAITYATSSDSSCSGALCLALTVQ